jgi:peptidoglycan/LPS O-acetylase OafA/YrhL
MPVQKRLISLEYLRGVAALMVLYAHVIIVGITDPATPKTFLPFMPGTAIDQGSITGLSYYLYPEIWAHTIGASFGYIGVSLFFLISGFVIVGSIERLPPTKFLIGRFFRIIPACAVVVAGSALFFGARYGSPIYTGANALTSAALVPWVNGNIQMIPVLWSLIVEAWFYVMIAGLFMWRRRIDTPTLLLGATICLLVVVVGALYPARWVTSAPFMRHAAYNCSFILNILVGAAIFNFRRGEPNMGVRGHFHCLLGKPPIFRRRQPRTGNLPHFQFAVWARHFYLRLAARRQDQVFIRGKVLRGRELPALPSARTARLALAVQVRPIRHQPSSEFCSHNWRVPDAIIILACCHRRTGAALRETLS